MNTAGGQKAPENARGYNTQRGGTHVQITLARISIKSRMAFLNAANAWL
jgi:hypothetical protein